MPPTLRTGTSSGRLYQRACAPGDSSDTALCLYCIAQEALHNILKYARVQEVQATLMGKGEGIRLRLCNDGIGFDLAHARRKGGLGLANMHERVRLIDGRLAIRTRPAAGTHLDVWVPLNERP